MCSFIKLIDSSAVLLLAVLLHIPSVGTTCELEDFMFEIRV